MLYLSFWNIALSNLPVGGFCHRMISATEASELVQSARSIKNLLCVTQVDLAAPYKARELQRHREMCGALSQHGIEISINDFAGSQCINPLSFVRVCDGRRLLVVDAGYTLVPPTDSLGQEATGVDVGRASDVQVRFRSLFKIDADAITFHLIEAN